SPSWFRSSREQEPGDDPDQGQRLDQRDTDEHIGPQYAGGLGLTCHALERLADQDAQTDARSDGGQAIADGVDVTAYLGEKLHVFPFPLSPRHCARAVVRVVLT